MELKKNSKKEYIRNYEKTIRAIEKNDITQNLNSDIIIEREFDKKISQYGILGKNLKNLSFEQKEKFVNYIEKEIAIKKKISENYNTEYFVEQERLALQRKLKYEVLLEIEKLSKIANTNSEYDDFLNQKEWDQKITSTIILNKNSDINFKVQESNFKSHQEAFEKRKLKIKERVSKIKNEWKR